MSKSNLFALPATAPEEPIDLRDAVRDTLAAMKPWLTKADDGLAALAMRQATEIELAAERAERLTAIEEHPDYDPSDKSLMRQIEELKAMCDLTKVVGWLGPQLQGVLRDLGGTPRARKDIGAAAKRTGGRLAQLRDEVKQVQG